MASCQMDNTAGVYIYNPFFGYLGVGGAMALTVIGAAYGTAQSSIGIAVTAVMRPDLMMKSIIPVIMAGIIAIYGLVVSFVLNANITNPCTDETYTINKAFAQMGAGLTCGLCGIGSGYAIGIAGDAGVRATGQNSRIFVVMILILIFAEVLGLYGMIIALILSTK